MKKHLKYSKNIILKSIFKEKEKPQKFLSKEEIKEIPHNLEDKMEVAQDQVRIHMKLYHLAELFLQA